MITCPTITLIPSWDTIVQYSLYMGAQWLSGRALDSRPKGRRFEPHRRHCVVSLRKNINPNLVLVQPRNKRPFITERLLMGCKESNQTKQTNIAYTHSALITCPTITLISSCNTMVQKSLHLLCCDGMSYYYLDFFL